MRLPVALLAATLALSAVRAEEARSFGEREALAKLQALDLFPDLENDDSALAKAVAGEVARLDREQPDYFKESAWPVKVARTTASRLGIAPRKIAEIRAAVSGRFEIDPVEFQRIHGVRIIAARFTTGGEWLDITPQISARMTDNQLAIECTRSLVATLTDESQFERTRKETDAAYWERQRKLLAAASDSRSGHAALEVSYEFESERVTVTAKEGDRLTIDENGKAQTSPIALPAEVTKTKAEKPTTPKPAPTPAKRR